MSGYSLTPLAVADLREIARYTRQVWGPAQAARYGEELELALQHLSLTPDRGRRREALAPGMRSFPVAQHVVFYVEQKDWVIVFRILHPRMNVDEVFEEQV